MCNHLAVFFYKNFKQIQNQQKAARLHFKPLYQIVYQNIVNSRIAAHNKMAIITARFCRIPQFLDLETLKMFLSTYFT